MNLGELFFSWKGEIGRLSYFLSNFALSAALAIVGFGIFFIMIITGGDGNINNIASSLMLFLVIFVPLVFVSIYCQTVLIVKRLHDIGHSGKNVFWIYGLTFISQIFVGFDSGPMIVIGLFLSLVVIVAYFCLLFMPGQGGRNYVGVFE